MCSTHCSGGNTNTNTNTAPQHQHRCNFSIISKLILKVATPTAAECVVALVDFEPAGTRARCNLSASLSLTPSLSCLLFHLPSHLMQFFYVALDGALPPTPDPLSATTAIKLVIDQFIQAPVFTVVIFGVILGPSTVYALVCRSGKHTGVPMFWPFSRRVVNSAVAFSPQSSKICSVYI